MQNSAVRRVGRPDGTKSRLQHVRIRILSSLLIIFTADRMFHRSSWRSENIPLSVVCFGIFALLVNFFGYTASAHAQWRSLLSTPASVASWGYQAPTLLGIAGTRSYVAVGNDGRIVRSENPKGPWSTVASPTTKALYSVAASGNDAVFLAVGENGVVLRSTDRGKDWGVEHVGDRLLRYVTFRPGTQFAIAVGVGGAIAITNDGGQTWSLSNTASKIYLFSAVALPNSQVIIAVGYGGEVIRSGDNGKTWSEPPPLINTRLTAIAAITPSEVIAVGDAGTILEGVDSGTRWNELADAGGSSSFLQGSWGLSAGPANGHVLAVGTGNTIGLSLDSGKNWNNGGPSGTDTLYAIDWFSANQALVVGSAGSIFYSEDGGNEWQTVSAPVTSGLWAVAINPVSGTTLLFGDDAATLRYNGIQFQPSSTPVPDGTQLPSATFTQDGKALLVVGADGTIWRSTDNGQSWQCVDRILKPDTGLKAIIALSSEVELAAGDNGTILVSLNDGVSWTDHSVPAGLDFLDLTQVGSSNSVIAVGSAGAVARSNDLGLHWQVLSLSANFDLYGVASSGDGSTIVAVGSNGEILRSVDGGTNWFNCAANINGVFYDVTALPNSSTFVAVGSVDSILVSSNDGLNWVTQTISSGSTDGNDLHGVRASPDGSTVLVVGAEGTVMTRDRSVKPLYVPFADSYYYRHEGSALEVHWRFRKDRSITCYRMAYALNPNDFFVNETNAVLTNKIIDGRVTYTAIWHPEDHHVPPGADVYYGLYCSDQIQNQTIYWIQPIGTAQQWITLLWRVGDFFSQIQQFIQKHFYAATAAGLVIVWLLFLLFLYAFLPHFLVTMFDRSPKIKGFSDPDQFSQISKSLSAVVKYTIFFLLGQFAMQRRPINAWIRKHEGRLREYYETELFTRRDNISDLPVAINNVEESSPWQKISGHIAARRCVLLISGPAGSGKTTFALRLGYRALGDGDHTPLHEKKRLIPLMIREELDDSCLDATKFVDRLGQMLQTALGSGYCPSSALTAYLLRTGYIMLLIDSYSELSQTSRSILNPASTGFPASLVVVTSRWETLPGSMVKLRPAAIPPDALFGFLSRYLTMNDDKSVPVTLTPKAIHLACARLTDLLRGHTCTPLLAVLWAEDIQFAGNEDAMRVRGVADLMDRFIYRILFPKIADMVRYERVRLDAAAIAARELGENFQPGFLTRAEALEALSRVATEDPNTRLVLLEDTRILDGPLPGSELRRISPDLVAEYMVARSMSERYHLSQENWALELQRLENCVANGTGLGLLQALGWCSQHVVYGRAISLDAHLALKAMIARYIGISEGGSNDAK